MYTRQHTNKNFISPTDIYVTVIAENKGVPKMYVDV